MGYEELRVVDRDRKSNADVAGTRGGRPKRGIDPNHLTFGVDHRAAGVTFVNCGVGLYVIVELGKVLVAIEGTDNTGRHGAVEVERVANADYKITLPQRVAITELERGKGPR